MEVLRFDFNGTSGDFKRTPQGFLRVNARLSKVGIFDYHTTREYRADTEVFRADSLESLHGAPVTDRHPSESSDQSFLTPANAKELMVGITEKVERDGDYLKGSLIIFHEEAPAILQECLSQACFACRQRGHKENSAFNAAKDILVVKQRHSKPESEVALAA